MIKTLLIKSIGTYLNTLSFVSKPYAANKALALFIKPRAGKINESQSEFLATSQQEILKYNEHSIMTYYWSGKKKTILLAHGWESNSARWKNLINLLKQKDYSIVALDAPAHGNSGSKTFNALLYSEFINTAVKHFCPEIIIGHSVGGMASVFFQNKYQFNGIEKMILLGAPSEFKDVLKRYKDMMGYNQRVSEQIDCTIVERFGSRPENYSTAKFVETINASGLIIHDELDKIIPYNDALMIKNNFKNSKLVTTQGLGHSLNNEVVSNYIFEFIED